jgi:Tfp pilus assembly protein PilV
MNKKSPAFTLLELLVAVILMTIIVLSLTSIDKFSRYHVINSDRRTKLQNELSFILEHITKTVTQGTGNQASPGNQPIQALDNSGFKVRVDPRAPSDVTIGDLSDDLWYMYTKQNNSLIFSCGTVTANQAVTPGCPVSDTLGSHLITDQLITTDGAALPADPTRGFYANIIDYGTTVEVLLVARWFPGKQMSSDNPQVTMRAKVHSIQSPTR